MKRIIDRCWLDIALRPRSQPRTRKLYRSFRSRKTRLPRPKDPKPPPVYYIILLSSRKAKFVSSVLRGNLGFFYSLPLDRHTGAIGCRSPPVFQFLPWPLHN